MRRAVLFVILCIVLLSVSCNQYHSEQAQKLYRKGVEMEERHIPDSAIILYHQALKQLDKAPNDTLKGDIYNRLGDLLLDHNLYETACDSYQQAVVVSQGLDDKSNLSHAYRGLGKYHFLYKDRDSVLFYFENRSNSSTRSRTRRNNRRSTTTWPAPTNSKATSIKP